ncbi:glycosyltransferase family 2 protein [Methylobacterium longum]|uniref:Glycosyltransferase family 2 protein n=1 Tax=Methylobacterium longum TaxID=767694 RepID=A0ABT8ANE8_9HYPH|nr:glycosyltransferase family 2 protein [Methylobacterium longum]MDN3571309.1 glycosyltransferase family 2 protein [Methylobacterium longum]GJE09163.1 putative glycosyltransferase [Methylobacterium longum]
MNMLLADPVLKHSRSQRKKISVVAPCHNEEESILEFIRRTVPVCTNLVDDDYELILVDDGSCDETWNIIAAETRNNDRIVGVKLLRNHGHQLAATAGLSASNGDRVLLIDADLQDPPELLPEMMRIMDQGADVVYGKRMARKGETYFKLVTADLFYRTLSFLSPTPVPKDTGDFRLMRRRVVKIFLNMPEQNRFIRGMVSWIGGKQTPLLYNRDARYGGETKYPLSKMIRFATDAITSFSTVPLRIATYLGCIFSIVAVLLLGYTVFSYFEGQTIAGWASLLTAISVFSAVQLIVLGIIGEYIGRITQQIKGRPLYIIDFVQKGELRIEADV